MSGIYKRIPQCADCIFLRPGSNYASSICNRVYARAQPTIETTFYPNVFTARNYEYLCGPKGKYFVDKLRAKYSNFSHIMG
jgi:hypothetical protein